MTLVVEGKNTFLKLGTLDTSPATFSGGLLTHGPGLLWFPCCNPFSHTLGFLQTFALVVLSLGEV